MSKSCFLFHYTLHEQTNSKSVGSTLGPVLANIFMIHFGNILHNKSISQGILYWYRYVDNVFVIFSSKPDFNMIMNGLDSTHPNIKFSYEPKVITAFIFLDVNV